jgi:hypothetical protein
VQSDEPPSRVPWYGVAELRAIAGAAAQSMPGPVASVREDAAAQGTPASFTSTEPGGGEQMRGRIVNSSSPATPNLRPEAAAR